MLSAVQCTKKQLHLLPVGAISGAACKLNSWVTHEFVGNTSNFGSSKQTKHFSYLKF